MQLEKAALFAGSMHHGSGGVKPSDCILICIFATPVLEPPACNELDCKHVLTPARTAQPQVLKGTSCKKKGNTRVLSRDAKRRKGNPPNDPRNRPCACVPVVIVIHYNQSHSQPQNKEKRVTTPARNNFKQKSCRVRVGYTALSGLSPSATTATPSPRSGLCSTSFSCRLASR